jgi:hypothetical protein
MFDDLTFALRYRCPYTLRFNVYGRSYEVDLPNGMTTAIVDRLKSLHLWDESFEPIIGPYVVTEE